MSSSCLVRVTSWLVLQTRSTDHESAFIERYLRLYVWVLVPTKQNRRQAEDLLHDAFVQFSISHSDLQWIQNLDAYLHTILRNMRVSQLRRASRSQEATLAVAATSLDSMLSLP